MENSIALLLWMLVWLGFLFSGYMSYEKYFESICLEPCPIFLGFPACYFGFAGFLTMLLLLLLNRPKKQLFLVASTGSLFAFYFAVEEMMHQETGLFGHRFYISICTIGWFIYSCIAIVTYKK